MRRLNGSYRLLDHVVGLSEFQAKGLQHCTIIHFVAFAKARNLINIGNSPAFFDVGEPPPSNPIALIVRSGRGLGSETLDRTTCEVKFFPQFSKPIPRTRHDALRT